MLTKNAGKPDWVEFKDSPNPAAKVLGEITINGHTVTVTDQSRGWRQLLGMDPNIDSLNQPDLNLEKVVAKGLKTLERWQTFTAVQQFQDLTAKWTKLNSRGWKESYHCENWRLDAALFFSILASRELGIKSPKVKFFKEARYGEEPDFSTEWMLYGKASGDDTIWLNEELTGSEFIETCGHEVRHLWQPRSCCEGEREHYERDAIQWGKSFAAKFGPISGEIYVWLREDFDRYEAFKEAPPHSWLIHPGDGWLYEKYDFAWWYKRNWRH